MLIVVSPGQHVQTAVNAAFPGDTILVREGVYNEYVTIGPGKDRLRIIGDGVGKTVLDGTGLLEVSGFALLGSSFVTIAGFTVQSFAEHGILIETGDNVIRDNELTQNGDDGIQMTGSRNLIKGNTVAKNGGDGIDVAAGERNYLIDNQVQDNRGEGIDIDPASRKTLCFANQVCRNGDDGIDVQGDGSLIVGNKVFDNKDDGIDIDLAVNVLVYRNECKENARSGFEVDAEGLIAIKNAFCHNRENGIQITRESEDAVLGLRFRSSVKTRSSTTNGTAFVDVRRGRSPSTSSSTTVSMRIEATALMSATEISIASSSTISTTTEPRESSWAMHPISTSSTTIRSKRTTKAAFVLPEASSTS